VRQLENGKYDANLLTEESGYIKTNPVTHNIRKETNNRVLTRA
jgi:hypothetical protein